MKTTKYIFTFLLLTFAFITSSFAQVEEKPEAKLDEKTEVNNPNSIEADGEKVTIKDGTTTMVEFVSQGSSGLIHLPSLGTLVSFPGNNLYSSGTDLYWGSSKLGTSGSAAGWTDSGTKIYNTTLTDKVGIGTTNPLSNLSVGGLGTSSATISGESTSGWAIYGSATTGRGVYGSASGNGGRGIFGSANGTGGEGVIAEAHGQNGKAISGYASDASGYAGYFVGKVKIIGKMETLNTTDEVVIGTNGTPFLEIREITGTTTTSYARIISNGLPDGWTGSNTRLLSFEIEGGNSGYWYSSGYLLNGRTVAFRMHSDRTVTVWYPDHTDFHNKTWRAVIMRMP